jgi:F-type H+-transporting ATPase subunit epsilon
VDALLKFNLVSPEHILFDQEVSMVVVPGINGDIGVLPNHAPLLTLLRPGVVSVYEGTNVLVKLFVDGGFCEIGPDRCMALVTKGTPLSSLNKATLELEIKQLLDERDDGGNAELRYKNLQISRAKVMEIVAHQS